VRNIIFIDPQVSFKIS